MLPLTHKPLSLGALAIVGLSSCSLPSQQAWRAIRQEGLISYYNKAEGGTEAGKPAATTKPQQAAASTITSVPTTKTVASGAVPTGPLPTAQVVPGLDGYVRTPFTTPARLVDVRGMSAGSKVICPYTRRPFLVPSMSGERQVVSTTPPAMNKPAPAPTSTPAPAPTTPAPSVVTTLTQVPTQVAANTTLAPTPPPTPQTKPNLPLQQTPPEAPKPAEPPQGIAIPGRPGFVNSPFAAKHQLVDVTGLPTGMEVKCPYTGKLFRVPPQASTAPGN